MRSYKFLFPLLLIALTTGCATVFHGTRQEILVETDPPGSTASAEGQTITTPGVLKLHRKEKTLEVLVEKEGYVSRHVTLTRKDSGLIWANMGFLPVGGAVGSSLGTTPSDEPGFIEKMFGPRIAGAALGALVLPLAAIGIDHATGAAYELDPPTIVLRLQPVSAPETSGE